MCMQVARLMDSCCPTLCVCNCISSSDVSSDEFDVLWTETSHSLDPGLDIMTTDVVLQFSGKRHSSEETDAVLQEVLRTRLRVLESNSQNLSRLFKDMSARLVSVQAEKDCFIITFKTVEEIWKFSTYLSLGLVARCLQNFLCDATLCVDPLQLSDVAISVSVDEEHLATLYLRLLLEEGFFFGKALCDGTGEDDRLCFRQDDLLMVRDVGQDGMWEGTLLSSGSHGLVPVSSMQPLPYPFYQWFLRKYPGSAAGLPPASTFCDYPIATGTCISTVAYDPVGQDELPLYEGEEVAVEGLLLRGMNVFVGRSLSSGLVGFVQKAHVKPAELHPLTSSVAFVTEEEKAALNDINPGVTHSDSHIQMLQELELRSCEISRVYRMDRLDESDFPYMTCNSKKAVEKTPLAQRQSVASTLHSSPCHSLHRSRNTLGQSFTSFSLNDTFCNLDEFDDILEFEESEEPELCDPLLTLLDSDPSSIPPKDIGDLCDPSHSFLEVLFAGEGEDAVMLRLESVRETAKRQCMWWAQRRACFLLGRLCARRLKLSQARIYFEEALAVPVPGFLDLRLLRALYTHLTALYMKQRLPQKLRWTQERACVLMMALPDHCFCCADEFELLKPVMWRALLDGDRHLETRALFLSLRLFLQLGRHDHALPFAERLQFLSAGLGSRDGQVPMPLDLSWLLSCLYHQKYQPHLALAALSLDPLCPRTLNHALQKVEVFVRNADRLNPTWRCTNCPLSSQLRLHLQQAVDSASRESQHLAELDLCISLAWLLLLHGALEKAVWCAEHAVKVGSHVGEEERFEAQALHSWMLVLSGKAESAVNQLLPLLSSLTGSDSPAARGVVHTLIGLSLRQLGRLQESATHSHSALRIAHENGDKRNEAIALANLACLALGTGSMGVAEGFLQRSLLLFFNLGDGANEEHIQALIWMGRVLSDSGRGLEARVAYELGLLIGISVKNLRSQMTVAEILSRHYATKLMYRQCIVYYEHCVALSRELQDKRLEGQYLEILGSMYLSLNTERTSWKSLDYTKQSLRISIDLGNRQEESVTWLNAGRIYYLMCEDELADMYLQAAVRTALKVEDPAFVLSVHEGAGDVFFKGHRNRMAALPFYRDGSLPLARSIGDTLSELRMLNKITVLLMSESQHQEALQYAILAVESTAATGQWEQEWVALHRLASVHYALRHYELAENFYLQAVRCGPTDTQHRITAQYYCRTYRRLGDLTLHHLQDAFDAMGYYQLALAAAMEDTCPASRYILFMKLAEVHTHLLPDTELCEHYTHSANSLKNVLAETYTENSPVDQTQTEMYHRKSSDTNVDKKKADALTTNTHKTNTHIASTLNIDKTDTHSTISITTDKTDTPSTNSINTDKTDTQSKSSINSHETDTHRVISVNTRETGRNSVIDTDVQETNT
ncbi:SH3 domain and tetratricopeptide repeat-containing protein 2 isoform X3 [Denticeps clupeoides]|uniref:SH3 domain-containing protein n=1 Tax=Denticeps clupeoides TaxID=299321 RepID=A0AAY4EA89_9TELE|nr:SH3 domain and tetratricopeptide repeat-containing protein 2-like isoform X3 [Denticeps clupeoides]